MTDVTQAAGEAAPNTVINVTVTKGKATIAVNTGPIPDDVYQEILLQGLKVLLNRGMSKITKETYPDAEQLKTAAMAKAAENLDNLMQGKIRFTGGKKKVATGAIMTEARRLAKMIVKDEIKRQGGKVSHYEASEITKAANALLEQDPTIVEQAKKNVEERQKTVVEGAASIVSTIKISDKLVAKAEEKKAKAKASGLSAKQAGKVEAKARPSA
ncbi:MAG TPA: hypothetical protein VLG09_05845 [Candidatus Saccharimonadales bacterium]|nr:hypothetical protein [Candidatus Saccharimonadales bacterium]